MTSNQPPRSAAEDPLIGRVLHDRYRVEAFLARGGMATIYQGADLRLDRTVAIKVMHPSFAADPGFVARFEREARAAARLSSPHAVSVNDQGNDDGVTYLVMEYVPGHTVRDVLRSHGALPPARALAIIDPVLRALAAAHRAGYVHRDVKPENVLISEDGRVKVTDFGLARAIEGSDAGKTQGLLLGTVAYLSPEQVEHDHTGVRSDVYSAGILLFELVTGQVPFSASTPMQVAYRHVHEDVPAPSTVKPGIPAGIDDLVARATRRRPDDRFEDADAFLSAVRAERAQLPATEPWAPNPTDTLVVPRPSQPAGADSPDGPTDDEDRAAAVGLLGLGGIAAAAASARRAADDPASATEQLDVGHDPQLPVPGAPGPQQPDPEESGDTAIVTGDGDTHATQVGTFTSADQSEDSPRRRRPGALWLGGVAVVSILAILALAFGPLKQVSVPDVLGKTPTEASAILATANLTLDAQETDFSEDYAKGMIMATNPGPNSSLRTGGTVLAVVSKGPERYDVPDLGNRTLKKAEELLTATKLVLGTQTEEYDDDVKDGRIVSSDPRAGESVKPETAVSVVVSKGPAPVTVPPFEGTNADSAQAALEDLGLKVERRERNSQSVARGLVISTDPKGGATAYRGDTITLVVSQGPPLVTVPNVVGRSESQARSALEAAGFTVEVVKPLRFSVFGVNAQDPEGGSKAPKGSTVTITVV